MGVAGLWNVLKPAAQNQSLTNLAMQGFHTNSDGKRGFRLGIDASIWFFHAEYGRQGENPVLRTLFFRCARLMRATFLPLFVFDGPKRPKVKRGKKINTAVSHKLVPGMKQIINAFGFEWRMAPGEAEAELAYLNRLGLLDGILSDDVDNFLFGAITVIRNPSNTLSGNRADPILNSCGKDDRNHARVFRLGNITENPDIQLTRGGMIFIALSSGGDYQQGGLSRCGIDTAHSLARCGFGDSLYTAACNLKHEDLLIFLVTWRQDLRQELRTNSKCILGRKLFSLADNIPEDFPDIDVLLSYVNPVTSESMGKEMYDASLMWKKEPSIPKLAEICEFFFEWGYKEAIIKRFRTIVWGSIVLRIFRRAVLDLDANVVTMSVTSSKTSGPGARKLCGISSEMIDKHFGALDCDMDILGLRDARTSNSESEDRNERLIVKIHSKRMHASTDGLLEYRLEIAPNQLVKFAESGIKGMRAPVGPCEWVSEDEDEDDGGQKNQGKGLPIVDPTAHLRIWIPAAMVKITEPVLVKKFEYQEKLKTLNKTKKTHATTTVKLGHRRKGASPAEAVSIVSTLTGKYANPSKSYGSSGLLSPPGKAPQTEPSKVFNPFDMYRYSSTTGTTSISNSTSSPPVSSRTGIKDLTKKDIPSTIRSHSRDLKSFYSTHQAVPAPIRRSAPSEPVQKVECIAHSAAIVTPESKPQSAQFHIDLYKPSTKRMNSSLTMKPVYSHSSDIQMLHRHPPSGSPKYQPSSRSSEIPRRLLPIKRKLGERATESSQPGSSKSPIATDSHTESPQKRWHDRSSNSASGTLSCEIIEISDDSEVDTPLSTPARPETGFRSRFSTFPDSGNLTQASVSTMHSSRNNTRSTVSLGFIDLT